MVCRRHPFTLSSTFHSLPDTFQYTDRRKRKTYPGHRIVRHIRHTRPLRVAVAGWVRRAAIYDGVHGRHVDAAHREESEWVHTRQARKDERERWWDLSKLPLAITHVHVLFPTTQSH